MRYPSAPDAPDFEETGPIRIAMRAPDPSYPDRARIDSDVRYLLRPPSTPWITFDKEPKEEVRFPETSTITAPPPVEPSNVVVATDIRDVRSPEPSLFDTTHDEPHLPPVAHPKRILIAVGTTIGLAGMMIATVMALGSRSAPAKASAAQPVATTAEIAPPAIAPAPPTPAPPSTAAVANAKDGWAKLTIKGPAKGHRVYLDGKMLLGKGERSFTVRCGEHSIAIGNKTEAKDVDVPCNGEYVVSK